MTGSTTLRMLRILSCALVAFATLEVCARVDDWLAYGAPLLSAYTVDDLYELDGDVLRGKPYARYKKWQLNSLGLRGPELRAGRTRILCIGASETFGMLESDGMEYPRQLETALNTNAGADQYEVVNLSYFGLKLPTANRLLPDVVGTVHPRVAVIYLTYGGYVAPRTEAGLRDRLAQPEFSLRITDKINDLARSILPHWLQNRFKEQWMARYVGNRKLMDRVPEDRLQLLGEDLADSVALLRQLGVQPVIVTHANRFSAANDPQRADMLIAWRKFYPLMSEKGLLDMDERLNGVARQYAERNGVPLIDAAALMPGGSRYFTDYTHFTDEGARTFASLIAQRLAPVLSSTPVAQERSASR